MTLLERREQMLADKLSDVLANADILRRCVEGGFSDVHLRVVVLENAVRDARVLSAMVVDLRDVTKYGPNGGR